MASPSGPASFRAQVSWNKASVRSDSMARYIATQRAVSETWEMEETGAGMNQLSMGSLFDWESR
jgi:hypothetical protein